MVANAFWKSIKQWFICFPLWYAFSSMSLGIRVCCIVFLSFRNPAFSSVMYVSVCAFNLSCNTFIKTLFTKPRDRMASSLNVTAAELNSFYALTSTDPAYQEVSIKSTANPFQQTIREEQVFSILDHLQPTAEGYDKIPV